MGYHLILRHEGTTIEHKYCHSVKELAKHPIQDDSIIYEGEEHWIPQTVRNSKKFRNLSNHSFRAGMRAEEIFRKQAVENEYILEEINQDQDSFKAYTDIQKEFLNIKRGDFLVRNMMNVEIDVKCRQFYFEKGLDSYCFEFSHDHLERHLKMFEYTQTPIVIAVYELKKGEDKPKGDSLVMIEIHHIQHLINSLKLRAHKRKSYCAYKIPLSKTMSGFKLLEYIKQRKGPYQAPST